LKENFKIKKDPTQKYNRRVNFFAGVFCVLFAAVVVKLFVIQVMDAEKYKIAAKKQYETKVVLYPSRGLIFDRNMNLLVSNSYRVSLAVDPNMVEEPEKLADILANKFNKSRDEYLQKITAENTSFIYLERKVAPENVGGLDTLQIPGLIVMTEPTRVYNYGYLASQILGFTNNENQGQMGIEMSLNDKLAGKDGFMIMQRDGKGNTRPALNYPRKEPVKGNNIVLTLDINIQRIAEEELSKGVREFNADGGKVVVLSTQTGEILGMSSYPTFDPNNISSADTVGMRNKVLSDIYEPGSTFKLITAAGSLEENLVDVSTIINTQAGGDFTVKDEHASSSMTFQQALEQSSNVGMMRTARMLGSERIYKYARDFGFGIYTGVELPGENRGLLKRPVDFTPQTLEYMSIGYQVMVNGMQLAAAYATIANNGMMMAPYVVKRELGLDGKVVFENKPTEVRQVISQTTAQKINMLLYGAVQRGTGTIAKVEGVNVSGKTGTSQRLVNGQYSSASHNASFVGFFPSENPVILIAVIIDNPKSGQYYGGAVSAPIFRNIATRIVGYKGLSDYSSAQLINANYEKLNHNEYEFSTITENELYLPNLVNLREQDALDILKEKGIKYEIVKDKTDMKTGEISGAEYIVADQYPMANTLYKLNSQEYVKIHLVRRRPGQQDLYLVPDVTNKSLRKAINTLVAAGFNVQISGSGKVIGQSPKADSKELQKTTVTIFCENE
jgi:cell division protein FtsI (penicillin-binding protein 3)